MQDSKIYLITCEIGVQDSRGQNTGRKQIVVSHGVGDITLRNYCLPPEPPASFKPKRDEEGIYIDA